MKKSMHLYDNINFRKSTQKIIIENICNLKVILDFTHI